MIFILVVGIVSLVFGLLLLVSPDTILTLERKLNQVYMTDSMFIKYRMPYGVGLLAAAAFMLHTYNSTPIFYILAIGILSLVFGILLIISPGTILKLERKANQVYMTDSFFLTYRVPIGAMLLVAAVFMLYTYNTNI